MSSYKAPVEGTLTYFNERSPVFSPVARSPFNYTVWYEGTAPFIGKVDILRSFDGIEWFGGANPRLVFSGPGTNGGCLDGTITEPEDNVQYAFHVQEYTSGTLYFRFGQ